jgi:hypothetical protein
VYSTPVARPRGPAELESQYSFLLQSFAHGWKLRSENTGGAGLYLGDKFQPYSVYCGDCEKLRSAGRTLAYHLHRTYTTRFKKMQQ